MKDSGRSYVKKRQLVMTEKREMTEKHYTGSTQIRSLGLPLSNPF